MGGIATTAALPLDVEKVVLATSETDSGDVILVNWDGDDDPGVSWRAVILSLLATPRPS
jgi:hypothetical protein